MGGGGYDDWVLHVNTVKLIVSKVELVFIRVGSFNLHTYIQIYSNALMWIKITKLIH